MENFDVYVSAYKPKCVCVGGGLNQFPDLSIQGLKHSNLGLVTWTCKQQKSRISSSIYQTGNDIFFTRR